MNARRLLRGAIVAGIVAAAWVAVVRGATAQPGMEAMPGMSMDVTPIWSVAHAEATFTMWVVMMAAMMLPVAARAIVERGMLFAGGYAIVWTGVSGVATALQMGLEHFNALSAALVLQSAPVAVAVIAIAVVFQVTPMKTACLQGCRADLGLRLTQARADTSALRAGIRHGLFCVGCCWALMLLLFVGGLMNVAWMVAITLVVLIERLVTPNVRIIRSAGIALALLGAIVRLRVAP